MNEQQIKKWVENAENSRPIIEKFFSSQGVDKIRLNNSRPKSIFTAGLSGSGKTEFVEKMIRAHNVPAFIIIDPDHISRYLPEYDPAQHAKYRPGTSFLVTKILERCWKGKISFIMDSTLAYNRGRDNVDRSIRDGWLVKVYYIVLEASTAYDKTQNREKLIRRSISKDKFKFMCQNINQNLLKIFNNYKNNENFEFVYFDKGDTLEVALNKINSYSSKNNNDSVRIGKMLNKPVDVSKL